LLIVNQKTLVMIRAFYVTGGRAGKVFWYIYCEKWPNVKHIGAIHAAWERGFLRQVHLGTGDPDSQFLFILPDRQETLAVDVAQRIYSAFAAQQDIAVGGDIWLDAAHITGVKVLGYFRLPVVQF
jgi:hypothetical protein